MLLPILLLAAGLALLFVFVSIWRVSPRPIAVILFLAVTSVGFAVLAYTPYVSVIYRREQPVVGLMLVFSIAALIEVHIWRLTKQHLLMAVATIVVAVAFWFLILMLVAAV